MRKFRTNRDGESNLNKYTQTQIFEADGEWEEDEELAAWKLEDCIPVYREPQGPWDKQEGHREQTIWFLPKLFGSEGTTPDEAVSDADWLFCAWDSQAGRWVLLPTGPGESLIRFQLSESLTTCETAAANRIGCECETEGEIMVRDSMGLATLAMDRETGEEFAPAGSMGWARSACNPDSGSMSASSGSDSGEYEIVSIGIGCCDSSSGSSSSSDCLQLPGIHADDIPIAVPRFGDYVLGYQDDCLVRFPVALCTDSDSASA